MGKPVTELHDFWSFRGLLLQLPLWLGSHRLGGLGSGRLGTRRQRQRQNQESNFSGLEHCRCDIWRFDNPGDSWILLLCGFSLGKVVAVKWILNLCLLLLEKDTEPRSCELRSEHDGNYQ